MKGNTVYLLYNTNASDVKVHHGLVAESNREWEYEDKDEFTIMFSPDDERKYTDIKILSKTKLKEQRPKSADQLHKNAKVNLEGIFMRRSNSLSVIEEDLLVLRRCPQIKPLLSETEIRQLQQLLQECRRNKQVMDGTESNMNNDLHKLFPGDRDFRKTTGDIKGLYETTKDMPSRWTRSASPQELDANKAKEKANRISHATKSDNNGIKINPILSSKKFKKGENTNNLTGATQEVKPKKQDVARTRSKSADRSKYDKRKSRSETSDVGTKKHKTKKSEPQSEKKSSKNKSKTSHEDENNEKKLRKPKKDSVKTKEKIGNEYEPSDKKQRNPKKDSVKTKKEIDRTTRSKESLSDQDQLNKSSEKTIDSKQKESKKKSDYNIKSKEDKTKMKKSIDNERTPNTDKTDTTAKRKPIIDSEKVSKDEKRSKSSIALSSKQNVIKGKTETKTPDLLAKKEDGKSNQPKPSPSDDSKTISKTNKTGDPKGENASAKKGKTKDKLLPGTIQYMIHYILSNPIFINLGWTLQPTKKAFSRIVTFKAVPANPQSYCFRTRENTEQKFYPSGVLALNIAEDGIGRINYPSGAPAIIMTQSHAGMKLTLYSCPSKDPLVKESFYTRIIGMFDSFGNGVIYDYNGKKILNFNQMEGIYYNSSKRTPYKWQWSCFKELEKQRLKELLNTMVNEAKPPVPTTKAGKVVRAPSSGSSRRSVTSLEKKTGDRLYEALLEELPYPVLPKPKIKMKTHHNAFKSIILKINKEITLRINGQDSVAVNFSAKTLFCKMDLGVRIDSESVERVDEVADDRVERVQSVLEDLLHPSPSLQKLHQLLDPNTLH